MKLVAPKFVPPLDPGFRPAVLANRAFAQEVAQSKVGVPLVLGLERNANEMSRYETKVFPEGHPRAGANLMYAERIVKMLMWQRGGWRLYVGGPKSICDYLTKAYSASGARQFDNDFLPRTAYEHDFQTVHCRAEDVPPAREGGRMLGRHLEGCRIGFDLGASDRKVSAVIDGEAVFSEEVVWEPRKQTDPEYHYRELLTGIRSAAAHMPRVDAIGGSTAGLVVNNRLMAASLIRGIPKEELPQAQNMFLRLQKEMGVPVEVLNDGDVTALAGAMSLNDTGILGIALGSSEAGGYVNLQGGINPWLSELAFCPVDYQPDAPADEWSGDKGVGALYFSQQCVFHLAPKAGIEIPSGLTDAERLKVVQAKLESGHDGARKIWESMGVYMGYGVAHYADFYEMKHVLILGRCTSGRGGDLILDGARKVLNGEFPEVARRINIQLPDEKSRRVGQSIAAASLPEIAK